MTSIQTRLQQTRLQSSEFVPNVSEDRHGENSLLCTLQEWEQELENCSYFEQLKQTILEIREAKKHFIYSDDIEVREDYYFGSIDNAWRDYYLPPALLFLLDREVYTATTKQDSPISLVGDRRSLAGEIAIWSKDSKEKSLDNFDNFLKALDGFDWFNLILKFYLAEVKQNVIPLKWMYSLRVLFIYMFKEVVSFVERTQTQNKTRAEIMEVILQYSIEAQKGWPTEVWVMNNLFSAE